MAHPIAVAKVDELTRERPEFRAWLLEFVEKMSTEVIDPPRMLELIAGLMDKAYRLGQDRVRQ